AQKRKSKPAPVSKTARAQSSTPPCAATANTTNAQMPKRSNLMVWDAPRVPEPMQRHPPRPYPESCSRLPGWEDGRCKLAVPEHPSPRTRAIRGESKLQTRERPMCRQRKYRAFQGHAIERYGRGPSYAYWYSPKPIQDHPQRAY